MVGLLSYIVIRLNYKVNFRIIFHFHFYEGLEEGKLYRSIFIFILRLFYLILYIYIK
jgi:hypothetical protein